MLAGYAALFLRFVFLSYSYYHAYQMAWFIFADLDVFKATHHRVLMLSYLGVSMICSFFATY